MEHTKEPWEVKTVPNTDQTYFIQSKHGTVARTQIGWGYQVDEANASRIVACVNACAGIDSKELKKETVIELLKNQERTMNQAEKDRDRLATENKRLREALNQIIYKEKDRYFIGLRCDFNVTNMVAGLELEGMEL